MIKNVRNAYGRNDELILASWLQCCSRGYLRCTVDKGYLGQREVINRQELLDGRVCPASAAEEADLNV